MNNTRTAIRYYSHLLKVVGYANTLAQGISHYRDGGSRLWLGRDKCWIDREPTEVFVNDGLDEDAARTILVAMLKAAIAERGLETKN